MMSAQSSSATRRSTTACDAFGTADAMIEWRVLDLENHVYGDALAPTRGRIAVPQTPGLGLDPFPDPDVIGTYATFS